MTGSWLGIDSTRAESMRLLTDLVRHTPDAYADADQRRKQVAAATGQSGQEADSRSARALRQALLLALALLIGFALTASALALRVPPVASSPAKDELVQRIQARRGEAIDQAERIGQLREEVHRLRTTALEGSASAALGQRVDELETQAGAVAVSGPAVTVTLDDAPGSAAPPADQPRRNVPPNEGIVLARDLQQAVNALWAAGAEAIDVNGHRLMSTTAIRFAGRALIVGFRPLTRPYVITAVGPPELHRNFGNTTGAQYLDSLRTGYGVRVDVAERSEATLPAGPALPPRYARRLPTPSAPQTQGVSGRRS